jgi:hypothetical protein
MSPQQPPEYLLKGLRASSPEAMFGVLNSFDGTEFLSASAVKERVDLSTMYLHQWVGDEPFWKFLDSSRYFDEVMQSMMKVLKGESLGAPLVLTQLPKASDYRKRARDGVFRLLKQSPGYGKSAQEQLLIDVNMQQVLAWQQFLQRAFKAFCGGLAIVVGATDESMSMANRMDSLLSGLEAIVVAAKPG